jgi:hypothetical protein
LARAANPTPWPGPPNPPRSSQRSVMGNRRWGQSTGAGLGQSVIFPAYLGPPPEQAATILRLRSLSSDSPINETDHQEYVEEE